MDHDTHALDRRTYLATTGAAAAGLVGLTGCLGGGGTGTLATQVTDQPGDIEDFESCVVTIVGMWLGTGDAETAEGSEPTEGSETSDGSESAEDREYYEYDEPQEADLVDLQNDATQLVDERELETGEYEYLQLDTDGVDATLTNGESAQVQVPGEAPLTFNSSFEVRADTRTVFTADFTPVQRSQGGGYLIRPVPDGITVEYEENGESE